MSPNQLAPTNPSGWSVLVVRDAAEAQWQWALLPIIVIVCVHFVRACGARINLTPGRRGATSDISWFGQLELELAERQQLRPHTTNTCAYAFMFSPLTNNSPPSWPSNTTTAAAAATTQSLLLSLLLGFALLCLNE